MRQPFPAHLSRKPLISLTSLAMLAPAAFAASGEPATLAPVVVNAERSLETNYTIPPASRLPDWTSPCAKRRSPFPS